MEMDTAAFVCIPANISLQATWSDHCGSVSGANNFYLIIENVEQNTAVACTVDGKITSASLLVQGAPLGMLFVILLTCVYDYVTSSVYISLFCTVYLR